MNLSSVAAAEKFTRIPLRRERNGALTVPCSIRGQDARLLVDTGSFITIFHEPFLKSVGIPVEATRVSAHFARGAARKVNAGQINDLKIGDFKTPSAKFGVTVLPNFTLAAGRHRNQRDPGDGYAVQLSWYYRPRQHESVFEIANAANCRAAACLC